MISRECIAAYNGLRFVAISLSGDEYVIAKSIEKYKEQHSKIYHYVIRFKKQKDVECRKSSVQIKLS